MRIALRSQIAFQKCADADERYKFLIPAGLSLVKVFSNTMVVSRGFRTTGLGHFSGRDGISAGRFGCHHSTILRLVNTHH